MAELTVIVLGAGQRGTNHSLYALDFPKKLKVVAVAEPRKFYRERLQKMHDIPPDKAFSSWEEAAAQDKFADCVFITTQDNMHKEPAVALANKGYHIFLEKPMAVTYKDCSAIVEACKRNHVILAVGHVLRYSPVARKMKQLIDSGTIGVVANIQHLEPVGWWHYAHSYVRGNWRDYGSSSFFLLTKACHDLDLVQYWMGDSKCTSISSFGSLQHFNSKNKPEGAGSRCLDCSVEADCPYSARKIYLDGVATGRTGWPNNVVAEVPDIESVGEALRSGPYGRCVYQCDNNVVDHQVVNMEFEGGATSSITVVAFTEMIGTRQTVIHGSRGQLTADFSDDAVDHYDFVTRKHTLHSVKNEAKMAAASRTTGHGGSDFFTLDSFVEAVLNKDPSLVLTGPDESLWSHYLCFAAEKARLERRVLDTSREEDVDL